MSKKKLRRQIADLTARMEMRERAGANLVDSMDTTDADVRGLADRVAALEVKLAADTNNCPTLVGRIAQWFGFR